MKKLKVIKELPHFKVGHVFEMNDNKEIFVNQEGMLFGYILSPRHFDYLIQNGWLEVVDDTREELIDVIYKNLSCRENRIDITIADKILEKWTLTPKGNKDEKNRNI